MTTLEAAAEHRPMHYCVALLSLSTLDQPFLGNRYLNAITFLATVSLALYGVAMLVQWLTPKSQGATLANSSSPEIAEDAPVSSQMLTPQIMAVITAAVTTSLGKKAKIVGVSPMDLSSSHHVVFTQWSLEGRRQIYSSHRVHWSNQSRLKNGPFA